MTPAPAPPASDSEPRTRLWGDDATPTEMCAGVWIVFCRQGTHAMKHVSRRAVQRQDGRVAERETEQNRTCEKGERMRCWLPCSGVDEPASGTAWMPPTSGVPPRTSSVSCAHNAQSYSHQQ